MNSASEIDFLIVGQGLAGSAVAMRLTARERKVLVLDQPAENRSSAVAAGMFNPITGRKMTKAWMADVIFPALHEYYSSVERLTSSRFFYPMPLYRPFASVETQNEWMGNADERFQRYISDLFLPGGFDDQVKDPFGGVLFNETGYLNTKAYLEAVRRYLTDRGSFLEAAFEPNKLEPGQSFVSYEHIIAKKIIFCQGVLNASNPWFAYVPINSLKGESLTIQCNLKKRVILNGGVYMVPDDQPGQWRVGSTYERSDKASEITVKAREELSRKLDDLVRIPYTIIRQEWGLRPTTPDRKPVLGAHPDYKSMIIFNGFGTKGVSLAPYFSDILVRWMENEGVINEEADVTRFN